MTARVLLVLLVISLVFNVAVLIGFIQNRAAQPAAPAPASESAARPGTPKPEGRPWLDRVVRELQLNDAQRQVVARLQERQQQQAGVFNDSLAVVRQDLQEEVRKVEPELVRIRALVDQEADLVRQRRLAEAELFGEFLNVLTDEQREQFGQRSARGGDARPSNDPPRGERSSRDAFTLSPEMIRKYDRNGNGRLEGEEAREARRELQMRRRELSPRFSQLPPLWPWFDRDGDGALDEAERKALAEFLETHRPAHAESLRPEQLMPPMPRESRPDGRRRGGSGEPRQRPSAGESASQPD